MPTRGGQHLDLPQPGSEYRCPHLGDDHLSLSLPRLTPTAYSPHGGLRKKNIHCSSANIAPTTLKIPANPLPFITCLCHPPQPPSHASLPRPVFLLFLKKPNSFLPLGVCITCSRHRGHSSPPVLSCLASPHCSTAPPMSTGGFATVEGTSRPSNAAILLSHACVGQPMGHTTPLCWVFGSARDMALPNAQAFNSSFP